MRTDTGSSGASGLAGAAIAPVRERLVFARPRRARGGVAAAAALLLPWPRRGDLAALVREVAGRHRGPRVLRWRDVKPKYQAFWLALVDEMAARKWIELAAVVEPVAAGDPDGARCLRLLLARLAREAGEGAELQVRVPHGVEAASGVRAVDEDVPGVGLAGVFAAALVAAYRGKVRGDARRAVVARLCRMGGVADLAQLGAAPGARVRAWLPHELGAR